MKMTNKPTCRLPGMTAGASLARTLTIRVEPGATEAEVVQKCRVEYRAMQKQEDA